MMSTLTFTRAAFLAVGVTLFAGASGLAAPLPTNAAAVKSLAPQGTTEVRWGGVGWHGGGWGGRGWGYHHWAGHGWGYRGWGGRAWGWGPGAITGGAYYGSRYYGGGYPYYGDAGYPPYDDEYEAEDCTPYGGYYPSDDGW
jgi:hypothetical protein